MEGENPIEQLGKVENDAKMESTNDNIHRTYQDDEQNFSKDYVAHIVAKRKDQSMNETPIFHPKSKI